MTNSLEYLKKIESLSKPLLRELYHYISSNEYCRVYDYTYENDQINLINLKDKIIKQNCKDVLKWYYNNSEYNIVAKNLIYFVDGRRSLVPYHYMYYNKYNSTIFNEDCIFNSSFLQTALSLRNKSSYGLGSIIIKPNTEFKCPNSHCQPYTNYYFSLLKGSNVIVKNDYSEKELVTSDMGYYRSNLHIINKGTEIAIIFCSINWMFNNVDLSDNSIC